LKLPCCPSGVNLGYSDLVANLFLIFSDMKLVILL